jgi:alkylation response protein AidB-like acyl-CoA dehydrogenase
VELSFASGYEEFRQGVRSFLVVEWQETSEPKVIRSFRQKAIEAGYLYRSVPRRYGGSEQEPDPVASHVIAEEFARAGAPREIPGISTEMLVPTLLERGEDWQKEKFIPPTLMGDMVWCQGYSEPGAGSDLASLKTRAVLEGEEWVINGQKVWTTQGHLADMMFLLARTEPDGPKHRGISYLLVPMRQPGIEVRPLKQMTGTAEFNEVFFTDARTPADWIVGERGDGWSVSKSLLKHERLMVGNPSRSEALFRSIVKLARETTVDGRPAIESQAVQEWLASMESWLQSQRCSGYYQTTKALKGEPTGTLGLTNKINNTNFGLRIAEMALELMGDAALLDPNPPSGASRGTEKWMNQIMGSLALSIAGGSSNIQRNIIAERGLGLPRDPLTGTERS